MWMQSECEFDNRSYADDLMPPKLICDLETPHDPTAKRKNIIMNFGSNQSSITDMGPVKLYNGVYKYARNYYSRAPSSINAFTFTAIKKQLVEIGGSEDVTKFNGRDLEFICRLNMVQILLELPAAITKAMIDQEPIPNFAVGHITGNMDSNGNGRVDAKASKIVKAFNHETPIDKDFLDSMKWILFVLIDTPSLIAIKIGRKILDNRRFSAKLTKIFNQVGTKHEILICNL